jgi:hypothetical protein
MARLDSKLRQAAQRVWEAFLNFGPVDDGRPEGDAFDTALIDLRVAAKKYTHQTTVERAALVEIVNAWSGLTTEQRQQVPAALRDVLDGAGKVLEETDLAVEE